VRYGNYGNSWVRAGAEAEVDALLATHPLHAEELRQLVPALRLLADLSQSRPESLPGAVVTSDRDSVDGILGDFRIVREVGRGGMGVVYEAEQISLRRRVALKVLPFAAAMDPRHLQRFKNEAQAAACLHHTNIVPVFGVGSDRGVHYYAMQFIDGQPLSAFIDEMRHGPKASPSQEVTREYTPTSPEPAAPAAETVTRAAASTVVAPRDKAYFRQVAEWGIQAAEALEYAHQMGIIHRDIKPANLLLQGNPRASATGGRVWIADFGLAHCQANPGMTMTGDIVGTLRYMSPEQALANRVVIDHRTDIYSLGVTLYEQLTLQVPFGGENRQELLRQIAFDEPASPRRINKSIPEELEIIALKAIEKNPGDRYATSQELADDLRRFLNHETIRARRAGVMWRFLKWSRRHPAFTASALAALTAAILVLSGGIGWVVNDRATRAKVTETEVNRALDESVEWQRKRRVPEALSAVRRAQAALAGSHADAELRRRTGARLLDLELLTKLEEARLESDTVKESNFDLSRTDSRYREIFQQFQIDVEGWSASEAGRHIGNSTVAQELAALLDDWAMLQMGLNPKNEVGSKHLLDVAWVADLDSARRRFRDALARED
jgi:serine/threonine protein kinase